MTCGIYKLTSKSGKCYIGQSNNIEGARWPKHRRLFARGKHDNPVLQRAFNKHGPFTEEIILVCRVEDLVMYEQACLDFYDPAYNRSRIAGRIEATPEVRAKISAAGLGNKHLLGHKHSPETLAKMSWKGRKHTPETRAKMSAAALGNKRMLGKKLSQETKDKLSAAYYRRLEVVE